VPLVQDRAEFWALRRDFCVFYFLAIINVSAKNKSFETVSCLPIRRQYEPMELIRAKLAAAFIKTYFLLIKGKLYMNRIYNQLFLRLIMGLNEYN
jgi:hypothetical protein